VPTFPPLLSRGSWRETRRIAEVLRAETVGGALLLTATVLALAWANSPWGDSYADLRDTVVGPGDLHLSLGAWSADGLLAIFFFVAGLELKREFVAGDLRDPRRAVIPVCAAVCGVAGPAILYAVVNHADASARRGWAVPTATDIAFALAVLAVIGSRLPSALRTFLLTLAVVDDLLAITIIAFFYTDALDLPALLLALVPLALFGLLVQRRVRSWWLLIPLAVLTWVLVHRSGVHATVAGVLLAFTVPVRRSDAAGGPGAGPGLAEHFEHRLRPISTGFAVPVFAFFAAGVAVGGFNGLTEALHDPIALGIVLGLIAGKTIGIFAGTWLLATFTHADLDPDLGWTDVFGVALLGGIGFTVSLLIGELAFGTGTPPDDHVKVGVLTGSVCAAVLGSIVLRLRQRAHRRVQDLESRDLDGNDIPDVYET
jgi:NhaA family Na+:H+ antiporter